MGLTQFSAILQEKKYLTPDVVYLVLSAPPDFMFTAGQYLMLQVERNGEKKWKMYSILNPPSKHGHLELCAKLIPGGFASTVFQEVPVGQEFLVKAPLGHFVFEKEDANQEIWFLCTGTGVTPFFSMLSEHLAAFLEKRFHLLFSVREKKDLFFGEEFHGLEKRYPNFSYKPTLTQESWEGLTGRIQMHLPSDLSGKTFYICGVREFVMDVKECLLQRGVEKKDVKMELYT